ncbi:patatin-like phospholipase family protein [Paraburkholderia phymatum]|uniref:patatin-like phospholipase family protein n=1 Tax=Paraburkholderia phymatum TaxID=148447 RepID=UPI00317281E0
MSAINTHAIVFGGGGLAGIAWEAGLVHALAKAGFDVGLANLLVGTSAGSVISTQLASGISTDILFNEQANPNPDSVEKFRPYSQEEADKANQALMAKVNGDLTAARKRIGAFARRSETPSLDERKAIIASRLSEDEWLSRSLRLVAVDVDTGEPRVFDSESGCSLIDAVAASCAVPGVWPTVPIEGKHYMDGGIMSMNNAWVASGSKRVLVLAPLGYSDGNPVSGHLRDEVKALENQGASVRVITPNESSLKAFGGNVLDPARRSPAAHAGYSQGLGQASDLVAWWLA